VFTGTHERAIDDKGRVVVPAEFRAQLADGAYLGRLERNLGLWLPGEFAARVDALKAQAAEGELSRDEVRAWLAAAASVKLDGQHRIFLPSALRLHAGLDDQIVFTGGWTYLEIWNEARWRQVQLTGDDAVMNAVEREFA